MYQIGSQIHYKPREAKNMAQSPSTSKTLIRLPQVQEIVPYSRSTIYSLIAAGDFPAAVKLGPRASAWVKAEIEAWAESRIAQRELSSVKGG